MRTSLDGSPQAVPPEPLEMAEWVLERDHRRLGPLTILQLALAAKTGLVQPSDLIWKPGLPRWFEAGEVPGLLPPRERPAPPRLRTFAETYREIEASRAAATHTPVARTATPPPPAVQPASEAQNTSPWPELWPAAPTVLAAVPAPIGRRSIDAPAPPLSDAMTGELAKALTPTTVDSRPMTATQRIADAIARNIVMALTYQNIRTLDDLANDERLQGVAAAVFDTLPLAIRLPLTQTIGRSFIEARIVDLLRSFREKLPPDTRTADLSQRILGHAPVIAQWLDERMANASHAARATITGAWETSVAALRGLGVASRTPQPALPA